MKKTLLLALLLSLPATAQSFRPRDYPSGVKSLSTANGTCEDGVTSEVVETSKSGTVGIDVSGTWTGTLLFKMKVGQGGGYQAVSATPLAGGSAVTSTTANGQWTVSVAGSMTVCVAFSSDAVTGTAVVQLNSSPAAVASSSGGGGGSSVTVNNDGGAPVPMTTPGWHVLWDYVGDGGTVTDDGGTYYWSPIIDTGGLSEWYVQRTGTYSSIHTSWSALNPTDAGTLPAEITCSLSGGAVGTWDVACSDKTNLCMYNDAGGCNSSGAGNVTMRPMLNGIIFQVGTAGAGPGSELQVIGR